MSGIYINGIEMPTDCAMMLKIFPDGRVGVPIHLNWCGTMVVNDAEAIPIQPHGRLIDADYVMNNMRSEHPYVKNAIRATISAAPTIIPAEEGE